MNRVKILILFLFLVFFTSQQARANIVLKLIAANPSRGQTQKVMVKAYLPKEAKSEDVVDKDDLEVAYDTQQGSYYAYGEYELKPGATIEKNLELNDIWIIPAADIDSVRMETVKLEGLLKNTEFSERIAFLKSGIDAKLKQITESQLSSPANPERHISEFRENVKLLEAARSDLVLARSLLSQARSFPTIIVWRLIIAIVIFLGILGISFYFIWHRQLKVIAESTPFAKEEGTGEGATSARHDAEGEKKEEMGDAGKNVEES